MHVYKYASMPLFKYASTQVCKYTSMQPCNHATLQVYKDASHVIPGICYLTYIYYETLVNRFVLPGAYNRIILTTTWTWYLILGN